MGNKANKLAPVADIHHPEDLEKITNLEKELSQLQTTLGSKDNTIDQSNHEIKKLQKKINDLMSALRDEEETEDGDEDVPPIYVSFHESDQEFIEKLIKDLSMDENLKGKFCSIGADDSDDDEDGSVTAFHKKGLVKCKIAILCFSQAYFEDFRCKREIKLLARRQERGSPVILFPVNTEEADMPVDIRYALGGDSGQRIMFFRGEYQSNLDRLKEPLVGALTETPTSDFDALGPKDVFVSYAVRTKEVVWPLWQSLSDLEGPLNNSVWIDKEGIQAGKDWDSQISEALYGCKVAVICLSPEFFESINCTKEIKMFARRVERREGLRMVPVFVKPSDVPVHLRYALGQAEEPISLPTGCSHDEVIPAIQAAAEKFLTGTTSVTQTTRSTALTPAQLSEFSLAKTLIHNAGWSVVQLVNAGNMVFSGGWDGKICAWDAQSLEKIKTLEGHRGRIRALHVIGSRDGGILLSGAGKAGGAPDTTIMVWDLATLNCTREVPDAHNFGITAFANESGKIYSGGMDGLVKIWDSDFNYESTITVSEDASGSTGIYGLAVVQDKIFCAVWSGNSNENRIRVYNADTLEHIKDLTEHTDYPRSLTGARDFVFSAGGGSDGTVRMWDADTLECIKVFSGHRKGAQSVFVGTEQLRNFMISSSNDCTSKMWNIATGECLATNSYSNNGKYFYVNAVALAAGRAFAAGGDGRVLVYADKADPIHH